MPAFCEAPCPSTGGVGTRKRQYTPPFCALSVIAISHPLAAALLGIGCGGWVGVSRSQSGRAWARIEFYFSPFFKVATGVDGSGHAVLFVKSTLDKSGGVFHGGGDGYFSADVTHRLVV